MKKPASPPTHVEVVELFSKATKKPNFLEVFGQFGPTTPEGKYLHWDELQYRTPPAGLTSKEWWAAIKMARRVQLKAADDAFKDGSGRNFFYSLPDLVAADLHQIDRNASGRIALAGEVANPNTRDRYIQNSLIEEAITSSQLEGAATTRVQAKDMIRSGRMPMDRSERMIFNNYRAMQFIADHKNDALSPAMIFEIHRIITDGTMPKDSRAPWLRVPGDEIVVADERGNTLHVPPSAKELPKRIKSLCRFAVEKRERGFMHPVVKAILLHFRLAYDHPFMDGNGRTARALFYWSLLSQGYWLAEFISISSVLRRAPAQYSRSFLYTETDENDLTYFIVAQLRVMRRAMDALGKYLARKVQEVQAAQKLLKEDARLNHRQLALLSHALKDSDAAYTIASHRMSHKVAYDTARNDLLDLAKRKYLKLARAGRKMVFTPASRLAARLRK